MPYNDIRAFIQALEKHGEIVRVKQEVDWNLEAGAITRKLAEDGGPAVLFEKIRDYPKGYTVLGNPIATYKRLAIGLDMSPDATYDQLLDRYEAATQKLIKPKLVKEGPCKEVVLIGDDVDLFKFPALLVHEGDGGRYLCTWHITATKDPDSDWINWGMYRAMIHDKKSLGGLVYPFQHIGIMYAKYEKAGKDMPFAIAINPEPISAFVAGGNCPYGVDEMDLIGGLRGAPLDVIKCETNDLLVPATSEIVIEGVIAHTERKDEGPFGEFAGYVAGGKGPRPVYHVETITHRKNPIVSASNMGMPTDDGDIVTTVCYGAEIRKDLRASGLPVVGVCMPPAGGQMLVIVSTKTPYSGIASRIGNIVWSSKGGAATPKIIVVDETVDPTNMSDVMHAMSTVNHPATGIHVHRNTQGYSLQPFLTPYEKEKGIGTGVLFDCTWPKDWPKEAVPVKTSFKYAYPKEVQGKVLQNWKNYGF